jgi:ABC-2 type transport system permease protein
VTSYTAPSTFAATRLVAEREIRMRLRSKAFLISTALLLVGILASIVIGGLAGQNPQRTHVAAVGSAASAIESLDLFDVTAVDTIDEAEALVKSATVEAAITETKGAFTVIGLDSAPNDVVSALSVPPTVRVLEPSS